MGCPICKDNDGKMPKAKTKHARPWSRLIAWRTEQKKQMQQKRRFMQQMADEIKVVRDATLQPGDPGDRALRHFHTLQVGASTEKQYRGRVATYKRWCATEGWDEDRLNTFAEFLLSRHAINENVEIARQYWYALRYFAGLPRSDPDRLQGDTTWLWSPECAACVRGEAHYGGVRRPELERGTLSPDEIPRWIGYIRSMSNFWGDVHELTILTALRIHEVKLLFAGCIQPNKKTGVLELVVPADKAARSRDKSMRGPLNFQWKEIIFAEVFDIVRRLEKGKRDGQLLIPELELPSTEPSADTLDSFRR